MTIIIQCQYLAVIQKFNEKSAELEIPIFIREDGTDWHFGDTDL